LISPYLYVATSGGDLQIFDVTNPLTPQHVQDIAGPDWCLLEASEGRLVNLRQFGAGVDIHTLTSPTVISSSEFFNPGVLVSRISTVGADLILLDEGSEVARWDISNPAAPVKKSSIVAWGVSEIVAFSDYLILGGPLFWNGVRMPSPTQFLADSASGGMTPVSIVRNEKFYFIASSEAALEVYLNKGGSPSR
jgi:hypothetical protein